MDDESVRLLIDDDVDDEVKELSDCLTDTNTDILYIRSADNVSCPITSISINSDGREFSLVDTCTEESHIAPELPAGKHAHMFISYSSDDRDTVHPLIYKMEREFGVRCIFDDRDFQAGMQIHENIKRAMDRSMKVVLFLSERFTQSGYCNYEKDLAFIMSLENGGNNVIPVKLEDCSVPSTLKTLTYVDATKEDNEDLPRRIMEAFNKTDACEMLPFWTGSQNTILENGFFLDIPCDVERKCPWYPRNEKAVLDQSSRLMIQTAKIKAPIQTFEKALDIVNKFRMRGRWPRYDCRVQICLCLCCILFFPVIVFFGLGLCGGIPVPDYGQDSVCSSWIMFVMIPAIVLPWLIPLVIYTYYKCRQRNDLAKLEEEIFKKVTLETYQEGTLFEISYRKTKCNHYVASCARKFISWKNKCQKVLSLINNRVIDTLVGQVLHYSDMFEDIDAGQLLFPLISRTRVFIEVCVYLPQLFKLRAIRYDTRPCCKFLAMRIRNLVEEKLGREIDDPEVFQELADDTMKRSLRQLMTDDVPYSSSTRHPVKGGKSCFCQMLELRINEEYVEHVCNTYFRMGYQGPVL